MSHSSAEAPTAPISSFVSDLDHLAADVMADWKVPGVALAVVQDGKVALTAGLWSARYRSGAAGYAGDAVRDLLDHQIFHRDRHRAAAP
jgi:CubicO group peptidase (beta-lactamase class C family)